MSQPCEWLKSGAERSVPGKGVAVRNLLVVFAAGAVLVAGAATAAAQSSAARSRPLSVPVLVDQALRQVEPPSLAEPEPRRRWSAPRLLLGVGMAAFGVYHALHERRCRLTGNLNGSVHPAFDSGVAVAPDPPVLYATLRVGYGNARDPSTSRRSGACALDWTFDSQEIWTDESVHGRVLSYADPDSLRSWTFSEASRAPGPPGADQLERMRGSLGAEEYIPQENVYVGVAAAVAGGLFAALFSRVDAAPVDVAALPGGARLSLRLGF